MGRLSLYEMGLTSPENEILQGNYDAGLLVVITEETPHINLYHRYYGWRHSILHVFWFRAAAECTRYCKTCSRGSHNDWQESQARKEVEGMQKLHSM